MNLTKLNPWNWFKHEEDAVQSQHSTAIKKSDGNNVNTNTNANSLLRLHREMDQLFDEVFSSFGMPSGTRLLSSEGDEKALVNSTFKPLIDVSGDDKAYKIDVDVPGMQESDINIEVKGDRLLIKGKKEESNEVKDKHYYCIERSVGSFERVLSLPEDADVNEINASLKDGVLSLDIARKEVDSSTVKKISIK
jgi:HSP20 family protein